MKLGRPLWSVFALASLLLASGERGANEQQVMDHFVKRPSTFEVNEGQTDRRVKFLSRGSDYILFLTSTEAVLSLRRPTARAPAEISTKLNRPSDVVSIQLIGAKRSATILGLDELPGKNNYFIGNDPRKWRTDVSMYRRVKYQDVYPGIDLVYYGNHRQIEHDFVVAPGADPKTIRLGIRGATTLRIDSKGDLLLSTPGGTISLHKPRVYQEREGRRLPIEGSYALNGKDQVRFEIAAYDDHSPLIIDPLLSYSTYLGGSNDDVGYGIAVDSAGNAYVTGSTASINFPTVAPAQSAHGGAGSDDAFVSKVSADGAALVYSTYLGGSGEDIALWIVVDSAGNAYVTGQTASTNFPTTPTALQRAYGGGPDDAFVVKLNAAGNTLLYATYLGGGGDDIGNGIAVDSAGNAYVVGESNSANLPTTMSAFQPVLPFKLSCGTPPGLCPSAFVSKLNSDGSALVYSTYLAGRGSDIGIGIAVDSARNAYLTGTTDSDNFPTASAFQSSFGGGGDAFVTKLNPSGDGLVYSTYLGGRFDDRATAIAVDSSGSAYVTGFASADFPTRNPFQAASGSGTPTINAFVTKFDPTGGLAYSTYLGGGVDDRGFAIAVDSLGNAYVTGKTSSTDFPTQRPIQPALASARGDAFVVELNPSGNALVYSTYLGGSGRNRGFGIAIGPRNSAYVTGFTDSSNFPVTSGAFQTSSRGMADVFVTRIDDTAPDFALNAAGSSSASINCGQTANYDLQLLSFNGFAASVGITCTLAPVGAAQVQGMTCNAPASVTASGAAVGFSVRVASAGRSLVPPMTGSDHSDGERVRPVPAGIAVLVILIGLIVLSARQRKPRLANAAAVIVLLLVAEEIGSGLVSCGGGKGHSQPGRYAVTVSGSNQAVTRSVNLNLTIDCPR